MMTNTNKASMVTIATHGGLRWEAASEVAGPYYLTNHFMIFASFGTRSLAIGRPGSIWQREQFEISRAAFNAIRLHTDETRSASELRRHAKLATVAARTEFKKWSHCLNTSESAANFQRDVDQRFAKALAAS